VAEKTEEKEKHGEAAHGASAVFPGGAGKTRRVGARSRELRARPN
jgi:hypothetical protein